MNNFTNLEILDILEVKSRIQDKLNETFHLLGSLQIAQDEVVDLRTHFFVSGGCIASLLQGDQVKDFDMYCTNKVVLDRLVDELCKSSGLIADVGENYREYIGKDGKYVTENAITLTNKAQIIIIKSGSPETVRSTFDYVHCTPYYSGAKNKLFISRKQYDACINKKLIVNNQSSVTKHREHKFIERGYTL